jgi:hypothetical protein
VPLGERGYRYGTDPGMAQDTLPSLVPCSPRIKHHYNRARVFPAQMCCAPRWVRYAILPVFVVVARVANFMSSGTGLEPGDIIHRVN